MVRDVGLAEDLAQDAVVVALERWPRDRHPAEPRRVADRDGEAPGDRPHAPQQRRSRTSTRRSRASSACAEEPDLDAELDDDIGDDLLRLIFTCCHPVLSTEARVALTLRMLGGLTTPEIARAFLVAGADGRPADLAREADARRGRRAVRGAVRRRAARRGCASVLEVVYLIFNEGYSATAGDDWMRPALSEEALRLGRVLAGLAPDEPEVHGLVALMEIQASRAGRADRARTASRSCSPTRTAAAGTGC